MQGSVKEIKNRIQEEFSRFHNLLDSLTGKVLNHEVRQILELVKIKKSWTLWSIRKCDRNRFDWHASSQPALASCMFIAEETPISISLTKSRNFSQINNGPSFHKDAVEKEIEQCGDIVMEQLAELDTPPQTPQEEQYPSLYNFPSPVVKQESLHDFCELQGSREEEEDSAKS